MKRLYALLWGLLLCCAAGPVFTQNTLDGQAKIVPEEEVDRQSAFIQAERERLLGHFEKAVDLYKKFLYDNGDNAAAWYGLARTFAELKDNVKALDAAAKAVENDPENQWYSIFQADLLESVGQAADERQTASFRRNCRQPPAGGGVVLAGVRHLPRRCADPRAGVPVAQRGDLRAEGRAVHG